jgi:formylmethanofuran dehydrogenase subunit E
LYPEINDKNRQQMTAYRTMDDTELFGEQWVEVAVGAQEMPGYRGERVRCAECGEGINYDRFLQRGGEILCLACADPEQRYYRMVGSEPERRRAEASDRCECS